MTTRKRKTAGSSRRLIFKDLSLMGGVFTANLERVRGILPAKFHPVVVAPRTALAAVFCLEYRKSGIGAYREVAVGIPLTNTARPVYGALDALIETMTGSSPLFISLLPVTSERAKTPGVRLFGLPKFIADIAFRETAARRICTLREHKSLELILELDALKLATNTLLTRSSRTHTVKTFSADTEKRSARMTFTLTEWGMDFVLPNLALRWGRSPRADGLRALDWGIPILEIYAPRADAVLAEATA